MAGTAPGLKTRTRGAVFTLLLFSIGVRPSQNKQASKVGTEQGAGLGTSYWESEGKDYGKTYLLTY